MKTHLVLGSLALFSCIVARATPAGATDLVGDPAAGEHTYHQVCSLCHSNQKDTIKIGPPLFGAFGRKAGTYPGYHYSDALKASNKTWTVDELRVWEAGARKDVPGTKMSFPGLKSDKEISDMIAYLQTLHD